MTIVNDKLNKFKKLKKLKKFKPLKQTDATYKLMKNVKTYNRDSLFDFCLDVCPVVFLLSKFQKLLSRFSVPLQVYFGS